MNKEKIYDEQVAPLMTQIIAICKANKIAMLASFHIPTEDDENLECTTALLADEFEPPPALLDALRVIRSPAARPLMVTTRDGAGNITHMEAIL